jgi:alkyldihydroxyacetonephosphate synthase
VTSSRSSGLARLTGSVIAQKARAVLAYGEPVNVPRGDTRFTPPPPLGPGPEEAKDGWGYADTRFEVQKDGNVTLTGKRYELSGQKLPSLLPWMAKTLAAPLAYDNKNEPHYPPQVPEPRRSPELMRALATFLEKDQWSDDPLVRLRHGHGHTGAEIWAVRYGKLGRVPDLVVYPTSHDQVVQLVEAAARHRACLIPFGGGTNVSDALRLSHSEERVVLAVNMRRMNRILWIDPVNLTACIEAGAVGQYIADELGKYQLMLGHEPDSLEFSTLGGWIATNASGMKKNRYGNIEDLVLDLSVVTADGVIGRPQIGPRESIGTNPRNLMFGSEGNYGIITSAVVKLFKKPEVQRYGSVLFPTLGHGLDFLYALQRSGCVPASVRVMDNTQFHFGQALQPKASGMGALLKSKVQKAVVTRFKGFDPNELAIATVVFEGSGEEVEFQENVFYRIAKTHGGMKAGAKNGERGYQLTFSIAYIRDLTFTHWAIAESFETSVPWSRALELYERVRARVRREHEARRLPGNPFFTGRITQVYTSGVCIYFYLGFYCKGVTDPIRQYAELEHAAREEILAAGGTLSHHHGIGKIRQDFMNDIYSPGSLAVMQAVKRAVDPANLFGANNHGVLGTVALDGASSDAVALNPVALSAE